MRETLSESPFVRERIPANPVVPLPIKGKREIIKYMAEKLEGSILESFKGSGMEKVWK